MRSTNPSELKAVFFYIAVNFGRCSESQKAEVLSIQTGQYNDEIGIWCAMGASDLEPLLRKLETMGERGELFYMGVEDGMAFMVDEPPESLLLTSWLRGRRQDGELWLSYVAS